MDIMDIRKNIKILLAEDIHINQRVIIKFLNKLGYYNITVVDDGKQCIEHACQENFDIILLDIRMPIINGEIAFKEIKKFLKPNQLLILESTVYPGATEEECIPVVEEMSGLTFNDDFFAGYSPERINPGDKEHRVTTIKKVTSGST